MSKLADIHMFKNHPASSRPFWNSMWMLFFFPKMSQTMEKRTSGDCFAATLGCMSHPLVTRDSWDRLGSLRFSVEHYCIWTVIPGLYVFFFSPVEQYCIWTDGLCALLGREMSSDLTRSDLDTLISMEMKLRLLDLENITIPEAPPPVPKEPSSYNFTYNYSWDVLIVNQFSNGQECAYYLFQRILQCAISKRLQWNLQRWSVFSRHKLAPS